MPAPANNTNAVTHGLRMALAKSPAGCHYIDVAVNAMRNALEALCLEVRGTLGTFERLCIHSACRWEKHSQLASRWLRLGEGDLSAADRLAYSREAARASSERDKSLKMLGLDKRDTGDVFDAIYQTPQDAPEQPAAEAASTAGGNGNGQHAAASEPEATTAEEPTG